MPEKRIKHLKKERKKRFVDRTIAGATLTPLPPEKAKQRLKALGLDDEKGERK